MKTKTTPGPQPNDVNINNDGLPGIGIKTEFAIALECSRKNIAQSALFHSAVYRVNGTSFNSVQASTLV
jgi:hypothetical protein